MFLYSHSTTVRFLLYILLHTVMHLVASLIQKIIYYISHAESYDLFTLDWHMRGIHVVLVSLFNRPIDLSISHFFGSAKRKVSCLRDRTLFFAHSPDFFVQSFLKIGHSLVSRLDKKKSRECTKKLSGLWDRSNQKKWEIERTVCPPRDWPKPHGHP